MWFLLDIFNLSIYLPFLKPSEEDIIRNINELKKYEWFKDLYKDEKNAYLIIHDLKVRRAIGKFNIKKLIKIVIKNIIEKNLMKF
ncbi:hypothetical protein [Bacillus multifaciens]|uniref:hypothetical protein n=1 Tax=Bacillus multifaciens TaxID=3068506 RepID=UPI0027405450|nr:hypothetical protein [Bacillus sp. WLY-B-L8]MDP7978654.1 hypothetical protein [Bacillus sp. WLY-B-L8]